MSDIRIEYPAVFNTFTKNEYGVFEYGRYPSYSVLAGQEKRVFLDSFDTLEEAKEAFPEAFVACGTGFQEPALNHLEGEDY